ncbi:hypothetical protein AB6A40_004402 [Gnathostoma spinigerum]|uniref:Uncharacterized protein n=1 Tax=Gnathostoma spinigerum TaxID=75299 RepID=A0ABD6ECE2_9BILA
MRTFIILLLVVVLATKATGAEHNCAATHHNQDLMEEENKCQQHCEKELPDCEYVLGECNGFTNQERPCKCSCYELSEE